MKNLLKLASAAALSLTFIAAHAQQADGKMMKKDEKTDGKMMKKSGHMANNKSMKKGGKMMSTTPKWMPRWSRRTKCNPQIAGNGRRPARLLQIGAAGRAAFFRRSTR
jgi:hypothetical protein